MQEKLKKIIAKIDADYADVRYEQMRSTNIAFNGKELSTIGSNETDGYVIRVLKNGGFATVAVTRPEDIDAAIKAVTESAMVLGKELERKVRLTFPPMAVADAKLDLQEDPRQISLEEKLSILKKYNDLSLDEPNIQTTMMGYNEVFRDKYFASSRGTLIHAPLMTTVISGRLIAKKDGILQTVIASIGGSDGFKRIRNRENIFIDKAKIVSDLLDAEQVKGGPLNVVLNPSMTGVFTHEAFGHFSEADLIENNISLRESMKIGAKLGSDILNIIDDPTKKGQVGYYEYDDEGVRARSVTLMQNGVLKARLHSMKTAAAFGDQLTGHMVAEDARYAPLVRMGCIFIEPQQKSLDDLLGEASDGIYILDAKGGQTAGENFTFGAQYAYRIKNGKLGALVRDVNIMGNLFTTLKNVSAIGSDFSLSEAGGCGKGQLNIKSCHGGPHILIRDLLVGGV